jgi:hypothetical protein
MEAEIWRFIPLASHSFVRNLTIFDRDLTAEVAFRLYKKRRHERFAVRAGRPVTQTTSSFGAI